MNKDFAFILGNGVTRLEVNPQELLQRGAVYGCNRIYQEFSPTVLVSTDQGMSHEIQNSGYSKRHEHFTRKQYALEHSGSKILPDFVHGSSSGPAACGLACLTDVTHIFLIGFDLKGNNNLINNIYAGTEHYKSKNSEPTTWTNWVDQIDKLLAQFPSKQIVHVNPLHDFTSDRWRQHTNFKTMNMTEFVQVINNL